MSGILSALLFSAGLLACSSATQADESAPSSDAIEVPASPATRSETGVTHWAVARGSEGSVIGYDTDESVIVELAHASKVESGHPLDAYVLTQNGQSSHVILSFQPDGSVKVLGSVVSEQHRRTAELIAEDLQTQPSANRGGSSLVTASAGNPSIRSLQPLDEGNPPPLINENCVSLVNSCNTAILTNNAAQAQFVNSCLSPDAINAKCHPPAAQPGQPGTFIPMFPAGMGCDSCESCFDTACNNATKRKQEVEQTAQKCSTDPTYAKCKESLSPGPSSTGGQK